MRILIIVHVFPPEHAPAGIMVQELAEDLVRLGHSVTVLTGWPNHPRGKLFDGWKAKWRKVDTVAGARIVRCLHAIQPVGKIGGRLWQYLTFGMSTFVNGLLEGSCDIVVNLSSPIFGSWSARLLAWLKRARFVYTIFDLHPEATRNAGLLTEESIVYRLWRTQDSLLCRCSDLILTLSEGMKREICLRSIGETPVQVIPFWIDPERISPRDRMNPWRLRHSIPEETFVVLFAGTIGYVSGAEILAQTASKLRDCKNVLILCVGEGVARDELLRAAEEANLTNIRFLPFQSETDLPNMQATADAGLVTLLPETGSTSVPSKVLGYMAAGHPVIASVASDSATAEMLQAGKCGIMTPPQDADALANAIFYGATHRQDFHHMGQNGRAYLLQHYTRSVCVKQYERALLNIMQ